jgi:hypothetical protein
MSAFATLKKRSLHHCKSTLCKQGTINGEKTTGRGTNQPVRLPLRNAARAGVRESVPGLHPLTGGENRSIPYAILCDPAFLPVHPAVRWLTARYLLSRGNKKNLYFAQYFHIMQRFVIKLYL